MAMRESSPFRHRSTAIMDHLRLLLVPFSPTSLILAAVFAVLFTIFDMGGLYGLFASLIAQIWIVKYCYVLIEHLADGAHEPPVMATDMLSPFEVRPWVQLGIVIGGAMLCQALGGNAGIALGAVLIMLLPASIAVLGAGEPFYAAVNPLTLFRLVRGLGPYYLLILGSIPVYLGILWLLDRVLGWAVVSHAAIILCEISFFGLIGGSLYLRRRQLGIEPSRSPERTAAREEAERTKLRARMLDEVFQQVRIGKNVEATRPLAQWMANLDGDTAARDARFIASQVVRWDFPACLNTVGSTLIRHLLRAGRADAALAVFEDLRQRSATLTLDSPDDLRVLVEYAESTGREQLAATMRLETPIFHPRR
jgi:pentatricopeptide repeat protein